MNKILSKRTIFVFCFLLLGSFVKAQTPVMVKDINIGSGSAFFSNSSVKLAEMKGVLYFGAFNGTEEELWKSDGTSAGTVLLKDIRPGNTQDSGPSFFGKLGTDNLLFVANDGTHGRELWKTDGTPEKTVLLKDITLGALSSDFGHPPFLFNGLYYFGADNGVTGMEIWNTDGTEANTVLRSDLRAGAGSNPYGFSIFKNKLFFSATSDFYGLEPFYYDGIEPRPFLLTDISPGLLGSVPGGYTIARNTNSLVFRANNGNAGSELWVLEDTDIGPMLLKDIVPGSLSSSPESFVEFGGNVYFTAITLAYGREIWRTDGTASGTFILSDINPGEASSYSGGGLVINNTLFFSADNGVNGQELWKTNGTQAGTVLVKDINTGFNGSDPQDFTQINGILYFTANDAANGRELWRSDGTALGTYRIDVRPGSGSSGARGLITVNNTLYFTATNGTNGEELWKLDIPLPAKAKLSAKVFLQGPYNTATGLMNDDLRTKNLIPTTEPYTGLLGFSHFGGGGGETVAPSVLAIMGNDAIVDWVFIQLRLKSNVGTVVATRSALLQRDGDIVDVDGISPVSFIIGSGDYYVAIRHRNHLGVRTANPISLSTTTTSLIDFTTLATPSLFYGTNPQKDLGSGKFGLYMGNVIQDGVIKYSGSSNDRLPILTKIGGANITATANGYFLEDCNMDGMVKYSGSNNDRLPILTNIGGTNITATLIEQF
jgi:ELWxxDGT repeat protein